MTYVILMIGFILLIKGADFFVDGSASVAKLFKIPSVVIGLTIVAMGTSAPEAAVSITAGLSGNNDIALSNIIGSNIFNLLIVVGLCALLYTVHTDRSLLKRDLPVNVGVTVMLLVFLLDQQLSRLEGFLLIVVMIFYLICLIKSAWKNKCEESSNSKTLSPLRSFLSITGGLTAIILGGRFVVDSSCIIAAAFGLSENLIGLTIVAVGTSLPELVTSIVASRKGENGLALGNAVGSCIFNILFILGVSSMLSPLHALSESIIDTIILLIITIIMFFVGRSQLKTSRWEGAFFCLCYAWYLVYIIVR